MIQACSKGQKSGGHIVLGGDNVPPLNEIGLTDLPKSGGPPACDGPVIKAHVTNSINSTQVQIHLEHNNLISRAHTSIEKLTYGQKIITPLFVVKGYGNSMRIFIFC